MKRLILSLIVVFITCCCKKSQDQVLEEIPEAGNYLLIDNQKYVVDSLSVTYQNSSEGKSFQILAINRETGVFVGIQYLVAKTDLDLPVGEFAYHNPVDLKLMTENRFHNVIVRCEALDGTKLLLDGLSGAMIETGSLKIAKDSDEYRVIAESQIAGRRVELKYSGEIKSEEFDW